MDNFSVEEERIKALRGKNSCWVRKRVCKQHQPHHARKEKSALAENEDKAIPGTSNGSSIISALKVCSKCTYSYN